MIFKNISSQENTFIQRDLYVTHHITSSSKNPAILF